MLPDQGTSSLMGALPSGCRKGGVGRGRGAHPRWRKLKSTFEDTFKASCCKLPPEIQTKGKDYMDILIVTLTENQT